MNEKPEQVLVLIFPGLLSNPRTGLGLPVPECLLGLSPVTET